ncbi:membrane protein insertase YidC [bacterium]|nr:membrane protein insertase YidC [candidate division CSSED10-310 bacterium]
MEKRTILAIVLSLAALFIYQMIYHEYFEPERTQSVQNQTTISDTREPTVPAVSHSEIPVIDTAKLNTEAIEEEVQIEPTPEPEERSIQIVTDKYSAILSTRGGHLTSWKLTGDISTNGHVDQLIDPETSTYLPGDVQIGENESVYFLKTVYVSNFERETVVLNEGNPEVTIDLEALAPSGLKLKKQFTFYYDNYMVDFVINPEDLKPSRADDGSPIYRNFGEMTLYLPDQLLLPTEENGNSRMHSGPVISMDNKREEIKTKNLVMGTPQEDFGGSIIQWVATEKDFFFAGLVPNRLFSAKLGYKLRAFILPTKTGEKGNVTQASPGYHLPIYPLLSDDSEAKFHLILAPKKYNQLKQLDIGIERIVYFGWISWLGKLFYSMLITTTAYVKNYGLSIIILTIAIKVVLFPLSHMSMKSMKKMQEIQPLAKQIQERFRKEPRKMQEELGKLYRKHGVSPMGGCLPMLIQIPVFISLYQILMYSIEMRGASFLWAKDLSQPDTIFTIPGINLPFNPLVLVMGITMFIQQKMTPSAGDPRQAKMMMFMPIIFTAMFWQFPSGLVLYWLVNNLLTILQQYIMNRAQEPKDGDQPKLKARTLKKLSEADFGDSSLPKTTDETPFKQGKKRNN